MYSQQQYFSWIGFPYHFSSLRRVRLGCRLRRHAALSRRSGTNITAETEYTNKNGRRNLCKRGFLFWRVQKTHSSGFCKCSLRRARKSLWWHCLFSTTFFNTVVTRNQTGCTRQSVCRATGPRLWYPRKSNTDNLESLRFWINRKSHKFNEKLVNRNRHLFWVSKMLFLQRLTQTTAGGRFHSLQMQ